MSRHRNRNRGRRDYPAKEQRTAKMVGNMDAKAIATYLDNGPATFNQNGTTKKVKNVTPYRKPWCEHWQDKFLLLDDLHVYASAYMDRPWSQYSKTTDTGFTPDIGFYLDDMWTSHTITTTPGYVPPFANPGPANVVISYPWMDRWVPDDIEEVHRAVMWILGEVKAGKTVDIGCLGGHGRTGTMLACILVGQGMPAGEAIKKVRNDHCNSAIETVDQAGFVGKLSRLIRTGKSEPDIVTFTEDLTDVGGHHKEYGGSMSWYPNSSWTDDEAYAEWQGYNDAGNARAEMRTKVDALCAIPPCILPDECVPSEGDCWISKCHGSGVDDTRSWMQERSDWEDWSD